MARRDSSRPSVATPSVGVTLLDPRACADPTIQGGVNIPFAQLSQRLHELPGRSETVFVASVENASEVVDWLRAGGRKAEIVPFEFGVPAERLWRPAPFLESILPRLQPGTALDLACGSGRDAVAMASLGWQVTAVDLLPDAIQRGRDLERRYAPVGSPPIQWVVADVENRFQPERSYDLVTVFRFLHRPLLAAAQGWLLPGGSLLAETFTTTHRKRHRRPSESHCLTPGELPTLVPNLVVVQYDEAWRDDVHTARLWARSM